MRATLLKHQRFGINQISKKTFWYITQYCFKRFCNAVGSTNCSVVSYNLHFGSANALQKPVKALIAAQPTADLIKCFFLTSLLYIPEYFCFLGIARDYLSIHVKLCFKGTIYVLNFFVNCAGYSFYTNINEVSTKHCQVYIMLVMTMRRSL